MAQKRRRYSAAFKLKVVLEVLKGKNLTSLTSLDLSDNKLSEETKETLRKKYPECHLD